MFVLVTRRSKISCTLSGRPDIEVLPDDFLEENAAVQRTIQDLRQGELRLQDGQVVAVSGFAILWR